METGTPEIALKITLWCSASKEVCIREDVQMKSLEALKPRVVDWDRRYGSLHDMKWWTEKKIGKLRGHTLL